MFKIENKFVPTEWFELLFRFKLISSIGWLTRRFLDKGKYRWNRAGLYRLRANRYVIKYLWPASTAVICITCLSIVGFVEIAKLSMVDFRKGKESRIIPLGEHEASTDKYELYLPSIDLTSLRKFAHVLPIITSNLLSNLRPKSMMYSCCSFRDIQIG